MSIKPQKVTHSRSLVPQTLPTTSNSSPKSTVSPLKITKKRNISRKRTPVFDENGEGLGYEEVKNHSKLAKKSTKNGKKQ